MSRPVKAGGDRRPARTEQGDDAAAGCGEGHADEQPLAEARGPIAVFVERVHRHEHGKEGGGGRGMGHHQGQKRGHGEASEIERAGALARKGQHHVGRPLGDAGLGQGHADHQGGRHEPDGGIHEVGERLPGRPDEKQRLQGADGHGGHADGNHLGRPPGQGQPQQPERRLALVRQREAVSRRVHGVGPGGQKVYDAEDPDADAQAEDALPVEMPFRPGEADRRTLCIDALAAQRRFPVGHTILRGRSGPRVRATGAPAPRFRAGRRRSAPRRPPARPGAPAAC